MSSYQPLNLFLSSSFISINTRSSKSWEEIYHWGGKIQTLSEIYLSW